MMMMMMMMEKASTRYVGNAVEWSQIPWRDATATENFMHEAWRALYDYNPLPVKRSREWVWLQVSTCQSMSAFEKIAKKLP